MIYIILFLVAERIFDISIEICTTKSTLDYQREREKTHNFYDIIFNSFIRYVDVESQNI
jgi:hypothetical protein